MKQTTNFNEYNIVGDDSSLTINNSSGSLVSFTNGNVGIGTISPTEKLTIAGDNNIMFTGVSLQNQPVTIGTNESDNLTINAGLGSGKTITIGGTGRHLWLSANQFIYKNNKHIFENYLGTIQSIIDYTDDITKVGLGTSTPTETLDVNGNIKASGVLKLFDITNIQQIELNPDGDSYILNGNIGIGTTSPSARLHVSSSTGDSVIRMSSPAANTLAFNHYSSYSTLRDLTLNSNRILFFDTGKNNIPGFLGVGISGAEQPSTQLDVRSSTANTYPVKVQGANSNDIVKFYDSTVGGEMYMQDSTGTVDVKISTGASSYFNGGNVGIGTTTPSEKLDVNGAIKAVNFIGNTGVPIQLIVDNGNLSDSSEIRTGLGEFKIYSGRSGGIHQKFVFSTGDNYTSGATRMTISSNGNVGINTTLPVEKLDVDGNIKADGILKLYDITNTQKISLNPDGDSYINGGNLGIGTTSPDVKLYVDNGDLRVRKYATGLGGRIIVSNATEVVGNYSMYAFGNTRNSATYLKGGIAYETLASTNGRGNMHFLQNSAANSTNATLADSVMTILNTGNVGIGTTTPTDKLDVSGNIKSSGYINGKRCGAAGYLAAPVNITVTTANTYYPIGVFTVPVAADFVVGTTYPNGLKYTGTIAQTFHITWNATIESTSNNVSSIIDIEKNGVSIPMAKMGTYSKTGGEIYNLNGQCVVDLDVNDEIRFVVTANNNGEILTFDYFTASIKEFFD